MPELGKKYECSECGTKFYDLGKSTSTCPKCGTDPRKQLEEKTRAESLRATKAKEPEIDDEDALDDEIDEEGAEDLIAEEEGEGEAPDEEEDDDDD